MLFLNETVQKQSMHDLSNPGVLEVSARLLKTSMFMYSDRSLSTHIVTALWFNWFWKLNLKTLLSEVCVSYFSFILVLVGVKY